jgi:hypothetical protein
LSYIQNISKFPHFWVFDIIFPHWDKVFLKHCEQIWLSKINNFFEGCYHVHNCMNFGFDDKLVRFQYIFNILLQTWNCVASLNVSGRWNFLFWGTFTSLLLSCEKVLQIFIFLDHNFFDPLTCHPNKTFFLNHTNSV